MCFEDLRELHALHFPIVLTCWYDRSHIWWPIPTSASVDEVSLDTPDEGIVLLISRETVMGITSI